VKTDDFLPVMVLCRGAGSTPVTSVISSTIPSMMGVRFPELDADLFDEISPLVGLPCLDQMTARRGPNSLKAERRSDRQSAWAWTPLGPRPMYSVQSGSSWQIAARFLLMVGLQFSDPSPDLILCCREKWVTTRP